MVNIVIVGFSSNEERDSQQDLESISDDRKIEVDNPQEFKTVSRQLVERGLFVGYYTPEGNRLNHPSAYMAIGGKITLPEDTPLHKRSPD